MTLKTDPAQSVLKCDCQNGCPAEIIMPSEEDAIEVASLEGWKLKGGTHVCNDCLSGNCPGAALQKRQGQAPGGIAALLQQLAGGQVPAVTLPSPMVATPDPGDDEEEAPDDGDMIEVEGKLVDGAALLEKSNAIHQKHADAEEAERDELFESALASALPAPAEEPAKLRGRKYKGDPERHPSTQRGATIPGVTRTAADALSNSEPAAKAPAAKIDQAKMSEVDSIFGELENDGLLGERAGSTWKPGA